MDTCMYYTHLCIHTERRNGSQWSLHQYGSQPFNVSVSRVNFEHNHVPITIIEKNLITKRSYCCKQEKL